jgi:hypothetical protein
MSRKYRRGQYVTAALTELEVAAIAARNRVSRELRAAGVQVGVDLVWSPEETEALRSALAGKGVRIPRTTDRAS